MAHPLLERLHYYAERQRWQLRYPVIENGKRRYLRKHFGPRAPKTNKEAYATAVLEASMWLDAKERQLDRERHDAALQDAAKTERAGNRVLDETLEARRRGRITLDEARAEAERGVVLVSQGHQRRNSLKQPQLKLLNRIAELEPLAERACELASEAAQLREENEHLRSIVAAQGRAAATATGPLDDLLQQFISSKSSQMKARDRQAKTMTPIRTSALHLVEWLKDYSPSILTSADLEACPRALSDFWDDIMEQRYGGKSAGWARKRLAGPRQFCEFLTARGYFGAMPRSIGRDWMAVGKDEPNPTPFTVEQVRLLWERADSDDVRLAILLGVNCGYRESDIASLERSMIDLRSREIRRRRHKTGAQQCHRLWPETAALLKAHMSPDKTEMALSGMKGISLRTTLFIDSTIKGNREALKRDRRTAKSLRDTASQLVEDITEGDRPHLVKQMLGHKDTSLSSHYRKVEYKALYDVIDKIRMRLGFPQ